MLINIDTLTLGSHRSLGLAQIATNHLEIKLKFKKQQYYGKQEKLQCLNPDRHYHIRPEIDVIMTIVGRNIPTKFKKKILLDYGFFGVNSDGTVENIFLRTHVRIHVQIHVQRYVGHYHC